MTEQLSLEKALKRLARSRHTVVKRGLKDRAKARPAHRTNANEEFSESRSANTALCFGILIVLAVIDFFVLKWF